MEAAGDDTDDRSAYEDNNTATTSARQLFSDHDRQQDFQPKFMARSMPKLRAQRISRENCDVVFLTIDGAEFWAHRIVLAARYAGCGAFFSGSEERTDCLFEWKPEPEGIVWPPFSKAVVRDLTSGMLELLIDLAYQVPIHERVGLHNVREALDVAEAADIATVRDHCLQLLGNSLEPENCVTTYQLALNRGYGTLCSDAFRYIVRNFDKVCATSSGVQSLMPDEIKKVLQDDELHAPNEVDCAFGAIMKWIAGNVEERRGHLPRLLPLIRFAFCSRADMAKVEGDPLVRASEQAREVLFVVRWTLSQEPVDKIYWRSRPDLAERRWLKPRVPKDVVFMFGGLSGGVTSNMLTYNCRSSRWLLQPQQDTPPRAYHGVAVLGGLIYFVGGFVSRNCYHTVVALDVSRLKWTSRANMQVGRCYVSVAVLQGYIYAMGGFDGQDRTSSCERYDAKRNQWEFVASMNAARSDACAAVAAGRIYIMGGYTGHEVLDSVECYDPSVDAWSYVRSMSSPRTGLKAVVHDDMIYVLGGFDGAIRLQTAERMDPRRGHWSELPSMTIPRSNFVAVLLEGFIYVAGGFNGSTTLSHVERYDIQARQWQSSPDLGIRCSDSAACVFQDIPNPSSWL